MRHIAHRCGGFTAVELLISVAIGGVLAASAAPSLSSLLERHRLRSAVGELTLALAQARAEAVHRGGRVVVAAREGGWQAGWRVYRDSNDNGALDTAEPVLAEGQAPHPQVAIEARFTGGAVAPALSYDEQGFARRAGSNGLLMGRIVFSTGGYSRTLCFGATRVREVDGTSCG